MSLVFLENCSHEKSVLIFLSTGATGVAKRAGGPSPPPNCNATNDKNMTKSLMFLQFQFLFAFFANNIHAYNSN